MLNPSQSTININDTTAPGRRMGELQHRNPELEPRTERSLSSSPPMTSFSKPESEPVFEAGAKVAVESSS